MSAGFLNAGKVDIIQKFSVPYKNDEYERKSIVGDPTADQCFSDGKTLYEIFMRGVGISGDKPCLGWRKSFEHPYTWISYNEVKRRSEWIGSGLIAEGARPNPKQFIAIMSKNRVEHMLVKQACNSYSMVVVPIVESAVDEWVEYILELCELKIIFVDTMLQAKHFLSIMENTEIKIKLIVVMDEILEGVFDLSKYNNKVKIIDFETLEKKGKAKTLPVLPPRPEDLHIISFSSGVTGPPNGVMLTHKNFAVCIYSILALAKLNYYDMTSKDVYFSFVSLSTSFESVLKGVMFSIGARLGFFTGNFVNILSDVNELKPTIFPCVPQFLSKVYKANMSKIEESFVLKSIIRTALKRKMKLLSKGILSNKTIWDYLFFKRIRNKLGGKVKVFLTGSKSVNYATFNFMKCVFGARTILTYGSTETTSFVSYSHPLDLSPGSVGPPFECMIIKLIDAPEVMCWTSNGIGEICVRGGNVFSGYYKDETLTKLVIDEDGWFHTGDIGTWLSSGALKVIDRKQNIFLMPSGKLIFPVAIESVYVDISFIFQLYVHGDSKHDFLVAVVVVDAGLFNSWCIKQSNRLNISPSGYFDNPVINSAIREEMKSFGDKNKLQPWEIPKYVHVTDDFFTTENGLLTPSQAPKRYDIFLKYKRQIKNMLE